MRTPGAGMRLATRCSPREGGFLKMATAGHRKVRTRLTTPLIRDHGGLRPASWDEAFACAATLIGDVKRRHGSNALGVFSCSKSTNEMNYLASKFARVVLGTHNIDSCNRT
jgi:predicted molibdopterin-dependent oxidoreductase YjgC